MRDVNLDRPDQRELYWGDFHKHITGPVADAGNLDQVIEYTQCHLDIFPVLCYPFKWFRKGRESGIREETVGQDPEFLDDWEAIQEITEQYLAPGEFVTYPAYEWHGDRTRWGDHNIFYFDEGNPLDETEDLGDLYSNLRDRKALALPHHTGYTVGNRGKDWTEYDENLSPVMEVYSHHGSSEGMDTPVPMSQNDDMGPRTSGGTLIDGLNKGHHVGIIASNDAPGLPGSWNNGVAGVWATELSREGVWEALKNRRTYGSTGDRIELWWTLNNAPMGSIIEGESAEQCTVDVSCPRALDRVELIHDGDVVKSYTHQDKPHETTDRYTVLVEFGWGPNADYGDFDSVRTDWKGTAWIENGSIEEVYPRFTRFGQEYTQTSDGQCRFDLTTRRNDRERLLPGVDFGPHQQGLIFEFTGDESSEIHIELEDLEEFVVPLSEARDQATLFPLMEESYARMESEFELEEDDINNPDIVYHNARKLKVHTAHSVTECEASVEFDNLPTSEGEDYYYPRISQIDGQYAWGSPIWVSQE